MGYRFLSFLFRDFLVRMIPMRIIHGAFKGLTFVCLGILIVAAFAVVGHGQGIGDLGIIVERVDGAGETKTCTYCKRVMKVGGIRRDAEVVFSMLLRDGLAARGFGYRLGKNSGNYISLVIHRYEERVGGNLGVERPAGIGFHMHLIERNILTRVFVFDEDQQALSENLFNLGKFVRRGARWITAEELARDAVNEGLDAILEAPR